MNNNDQRFSSVRIDISTVLRPFGEERKSLEKLRRSTNVESILFCLFDMLSVEDCRILFSSIDRKHLTRKSLQLFSELCMKRYLESDKIIFKDSIRNSKIDGFLFVLFEEFRSQFSIDYFHVIVDQFEHLNEFKIEQIRKSLEQNDLILKNLFKKNEVAHDDSIIHLSSTPAQSIYVHYKGKSLIQPGTKFIIDNRKNSSFPSEGTCRKFFVDLSKRKSLEIFPKNSSKPIEIELKYLYSEENFNEKTILPLKLRVVALDRNSKKFRFGIVGEEANRNNRNRCLIFFNEQNETLSAFYCAASDLHVCLDQNEPFEEFDREKDFLKNYFENYPERMMLRVKPGATVKVRASNPHSAVVLKVDCSMMLLELSQTKENLWIYRGSTLIDKMKNFYSTPNKDFLRHSARQHLSARKSNVPEIICSNDELKVKNEQIENETIRSKRIRFSIEQKNSSIVSSNQPKIVTDPIFIELTRDFLLHYDRDFLPHLCSSRCVFQAEKYFHQLPRTINPFLKPFACHWTLLENLRIRKCNDVKLKTTRPIIIYCSPCGRKFCNENQVDQYLRQTKSKLTIELFIFDSAINLKQIFQSNGKFLSLDISNGQENLPISAVNEIDDEQPQKFIYRVERTPVEGVKMVTYEPTMTCCSCTDGCRDRARCACWLKTLKYAELIDDERVKSMKTKNKTQEEILYQLGYGFRRLYKNVPGGIYECNNRCSCQQETCSNRVVQNGIIAQLQLFKTPARGWGVRTLHDLPMGTFISVYSGEIFTSEQADERGKQIGDEYQADLDFFENINPDENDSDEEKSISELDDNLTDSDENRSPNRSVHRSLRNSTVQLRSRPSRTQRNSERKSGQTSIVNRTNVPDYDGVVYTLDAKLVGNIGRYFNHSCSPNIAVQNVFVDTHDIHFPWIGFFTTKNIRAGTELCWDYNYTVGEIAGRRIDCNCGAAECRRRML